MVRRAWGRFRRGAGIAIGFVLIAVGLVGIWIPFTFHLLGLLVVAGAIMVLRNSIAWRRRFIRLHRRHPRHVHRLRRLLRRNPEIIPVVWHEMLRSERFFLPQRWRRLRRWRRGLFDRFRPRTRKATGAAPTYDQAYFEGLYQVDADPWKFETSDYENQKYDATIAELGGRRFSRALEIGCSIGVLTRKLAPLADAVVALDISASAILTARARNPELANVQFLEADFLDADLLGPFDLIIVSEVLYYLPANRLAEAARRLAALLAAEGEIVLVHWLGQGHHPLSGDEATEGFLAALGPDFQRVGGLRRKRYRLDITKRLPSGSLNLRNVPQG